MKLFLAVLSITVLVGFGFSSKPKNTKKDILALVQSQAGAEAKSCGIIEDAKNADEAFSCAYNNRPYWFAINYGQIGWWAVAMPKEGNPILISTPGYYWEHKRKLVVQQCKKLQFNQIYDQQPIQCLQDDRK